MNGADPRADKKRASTARKAEAAALAPKTHAQTFGEVADAYVERQERRGLLGRSPTHRRQWRNTLASLPASFRNLPVAGIGPKQVFDAIDPIWDKKPETASRLRGRIQAVLDHAREPDDTRPNPAAWSGWLKTKLGDPKALGKIDRKTGERVARSNHAAMPYADVPAFMARLKEIDGVSPLALQFLVLTCTRTNETLGARWGEIDEAAAIWTVPAIRAKIAKAHPVPLSDRALAILRQARAHAKREPDAEAFVFPGQRPRRPLNDMAFLLVLRRMNLDVTAHGFRSAARSWMGDHGVEFEIAEQCLGHTVGNAVTQAYLRTTMVERRRTAMQAWANYACGGDSGENVVAFPPARAAP
jgi:integrase